MEDGAIYTCVASNAAGSGVDSVSLNIFPILHVTAIVVLSTEIEVSWEDAPAIDENNNVYKVEYLPLQTFEGQITTNYINTTHFNTTLTGLQEYVEYNISVRAYSSVGSGPYSDPVTVKTLEDSKRFNIISHLSD